MTKQLLFTRKRSPKSKLNAFIQQQELCLTYKDTQKSIYENDIMMLSITKYVLQVLLYEDTKVFLEQEIKKFFYGDTYEHSKNTKR